MGQKVMDGLAATKPAARDLKPCNGATQLGHRIGQGKPRSVGRQKGQQNLAFVATSGLVEGSKVWFPEPLTRKPHEPYTAKVRKALDVGHRA